MSCTLLVTPQPRIHFEKVAAGFSSSMMVTIPHEGSGRIAVIDQIGVVTILTRYQVTGGDGTLLISTLPAGMMSGGDPPDINNITPPDYHM